MNLRQAVSIEELNAHSVDTAAHHCGIRVEDLGEDWVEASMPFDARTSAVDGSLRLGALAILAESVGSLAATISVDRGKYLCLGQTLQVSHLNPAAAGPVRARATPLLAELEGGRQIWSIAIADALFTPIAHAQLSMVVLPISQLRR